MPKAKKKVFKPKPLVKYGFQLDPENSTGQREVFHGDKMIGRYHDREFFPSILGGSLGFLWMAVHKPADLLFFLDRMWKNIQTPPSRKSFKKLVSADG